MTYFGMTDSMCRCLSWLIRKRQYVELGIKPHACSTGFDSFKVTLACAATSVQLMLAVCDGEKVV